jgi:hypothetical protein
MIALKLLAHSRFAPEARELAEVERLLGTALSGFASELRLFDAADLAAFIRLGQFANLRSLVASAAELYFKPGTLDLAELGDADLDWFRPPIIALALIFAQSGVRVSFTLRLAALTASIEVSAAAADCASAAELPAQVGRALAEARLSDLTAQSAR